MQHDQSTGTILIGGGDDDKPVDKSISHIVVDDATGLVMMEAHLVEEVKIVSAAVVDTNLIEAEYKQRLEQDSRKVRNKLTYAGIVLLLVVVALVVGTVVGLHKNDSSDSTDGTETTFASPTDLSWKSHVPHLMVQQIVLTWFHLTLAKVHQYG